jgi:hypothetical protein
MSIIESAAKPLEKSMKNEQNEQTKYEYEHPNWSPLLALVGERNMSDWMWMYRANGYEWYKHCQTRQYIQLPTVRKEGNK